jgi:hypothetical protein
MLTNREKARVTNVAQDEIFLKIRKNSKRHGREICLC